MLAGGSASRDSLAPTARVPNPMASPFMLASLNSCGRTARRMLPFPAFHGPPVQTRCETEVASCGAQALSLLLLVPQTSSAIELHWANGSTDLTFSTATKCMLVLQADSAEVTLPSQWRLLWLADSAGVNVVPVDLPEACEADTAKASAVDPPSTPADSAANQVTAHFCSAGEAAATRAYFLLDQPGGSRGRLKVVALDPTDPDSNRVIESNEVTFNGGIDGPYPPVILSATSEHSTVLLRISVVGAGLDSVTAMRVGSADHLWDVPLTIESKSKSWLTATAEVAASLPEAVLVASTAGGAASEAALPADPITTAEVSSTAADTIAYVDPDATIYPKDFAFFYNSVPIGTTGARKGLFHLFYIRQINGGPDSIIAHAWCDTLGAKWTLDRTAFRPSGLTWDKMKVWAPSIQQVGNRVYMFYTGVDSLGNQSIGYAYTDSLFTTNIPWHRFKAPVYRASMTGWADPGSPQQFRDPFVMPDPDPAFRGRYLLFNCGQDRALAPHYAIGVARNELGTFDRWTDMGKYVATDHNPGHLPVPGALESPLVVRDSLTGAWRMFVANASYDFFNSTYFITENVGDSVTDVAAASWPGRDSLFFYAGNDDNLIGWQATEHLQIGNVHFFAAYNGPPMRAIGITRMHWDPIGMKFFFVHPTNTAVGPDQSPSQVRFYVSEFRPGAGMVRFVVESEVKVSPQLVIYDLAGRKLRELVGEQPMVGRKEMQWDCRDRAGRRVPTGMYFARLTRAGRAQVIRVPIVR